jgi:phosphoribosylglycinamide formyltransferase-1
VIRIGILAGTKGGVFRAARAILRDAGVECEFVVATDRPCGIETFCADEGIAWRRCEAADNAGFSRAARAFLEEQGAVDAALLFLTRLVIAELYTAVPTFNLHPSLLPAFRGFRALERARDAGARGDGAGVVSAEGVADARAGGDVG